MNFVWLLGSGSNFQDEEIRYSIRSVLKFHPDATITIIGECPHFYTGSHYYIPDDTGNPYLNTWNKALKGCELFDEWICMNDDFYLLEPFKVAHYYCGLLKDQAIKAGGGDWGKLLKETIKVLPDAKRWTVHTPTAILSKEFRELTDIYRNKRVINWKAMYCELSKYPKFSVKKNCKIRGTIKDIKTPFFSIANNFRRNQELFHRLYPNKCIYEK